jgi:leukotriene-A4 hydrolase
LEGETVFGSSEESQPFGRALRVPLGATRPKGETVSCSVEYTTTEASSAVQFLDASQTADKVAPFLFTQCQAIHARSLLPCQDTPGCKTTYSARVRVPSGITALMSALAKDDEAGTEADADSALFSFEQPVPVPPYLIALAAGNLAQRPLAGESTMSVWAEPSIVDAAAEEFAETPAFVRAGVELMGPYEWGRYDLLVLPPTFPYGGMENPCLTFVTPTLLAGDKSLADVVAHEICHSWAGNLVTCATWEHFWLNEGATMMAQRMIVGAVSEASSSPHWGSLRGSLNFQFDAAKGESTLNSTVDQFMERGQGPFTVLVPQLEGVDPDDVFSSVPYEKGFLLFDAVRRAVGEPRFRAWFKQWFQTYRRRCVTSQDMREHVTAHFAAGGAGLGEGEEPVDLEGAIEWERWFGEEGAAPTSPLEWDDEGVRSGCEALAEVWVAIGDGEPDAMGSWSAGQKVVFLDAMIGKASGETRLRRWFMRGKCA